MRSAMTIVTEAHWHFSCPECGFGDAEFGHLVAVDEIHCVVCLQEDGRHVTLTRWVATAAPAETRPQARRAMQMRSDAAD